MTERKMVNLSLRDLIAFAGGGCAVAFIVGAFAVGHAQQKVPTLTPADRLEIQELLNRYVFILDSCPDHHNGLEFADLFTEDGALGNSKGREALARAAGLTSDGNCLPRRVRGETNQIHLNLAPIIVPSPEGARGTSYLLEMDGPAKQIYWSGWYEDTYVKTAKGWRFKTRVRGAGLEAGIPANAPALRGELDRIVSESLAKNGPQAATAAGSGGDAQGRGTPRRHDPLNWADGKQ